MLLNLIIYELSYELQWEDHYSYKVRLTESTSCFSRSVSVSHASVNELLNSLSLKASIVTIRAKHKLHSCFTK
jgi:hypothetical protein